MMKKLVWILNLGICSCGFAQNLVTNYSFEIFSSCPTGTSQIYQATGWSALIHDPDYYNTCTNGISNVGVPSNVCGYQQPSTGSAYAGILGYGSFANTLIPNEREYMAGTLSQPLSAGTRYFVSFRAARMNKSSHVIDHLGAKFVFNNSSLGISNQAHVFTTTLIGDTLNWTLIKGSFIADSAYTYIAVGNHFNDSNTTALQVAPVTFGWNAYYFIEDVCVSTDSNLCYSSLGIKSYFFNEHVKLGPNPFSDKIMLEMENFTEPLTVILFDLSGREALSEEFVGPGTINTTQLEKGIYFYKIRNGTGVSKTGKLVKN